MEREEREREGDRAAIDFGSAGSSGWLQGLEKV